LILAIGRSTLITGFRLIIWNDLCDLFYTIQASAGAPVQ